MGKKYVKVTAEMVRTAHQYEDDPRKFTREEIAAMAGTSLTTLHRILHGEYDYLLAPVEQVHADGQTTVVPFSEIRHMMACENVVKLLLETAVLSDQDATKLFVPASQVRKALELFVPQEVEARVEALTYESDT